MLICDDDLTAVVDLLDPAQLQKLYVRLGLQETEMNKATCGLEKGDCIDFEILRLWRRTRKMGATKDAILSALEKCGNMETRDMLLARWPGMKLI